DDVIFVGQWNDSNIDTLVHVLDCFYHTSGLRINMCNSKLMGISVGEESVNQAASKIGCLALKVPFSYLGTKVGGIMSLIHSWKEIIDSINEDFIDRRVIKAIHGDDGKMGKYHKSAISSPWLDIVHELELFKQQGIDVNSFIHKKLGNEEETVFWDEIWCDNEAFKYIYPRLYALETCKPIDVAAKFAHTSIDHFFRRCPRSGVEQTQLSDLRSKLAAVSLVDARDKWK
nr:RNA-directed DNA polymerase, eukaryota, reverse transcriptase zinc-binding domain protein [Tanacetum cinerariifolium]